MKSSSICLIRVNGPGGSSSVVSVEADRFTIGRVGADMLVQDKGVSRVHLTVHVRGREVWLEDMNSANGTFIDNHKIAPMTPVACRQGSKVRLGLGGDTYSFEISERIITQAAAHAEEEALEKNPSRALSTPAPTVELAAQADKFLREARETASGIKEAASREAENLLNNSRNKANETLSSARAEAIALIEKARNSASQATLDREAAAESALKSARKEALLIKSQADEEVEKLNKEGRFAAAQVKLQAQTEAENIIRTARERADELKDQAEEDARELVKSTREKTRQALEANEIEINEAMAHARKAAGAIRAEADIQLEKARAYVAEKGATLLKESEAQGARIIQDAEEQAEEIRKGAEQESQRAVDAALSEAREDVERIRADAAAEIKRLQEQQTRLEFEVGAIEKRMRDLHAETEQTIKHLKASSENTIAEIKAKTEAAEQENTQANQRLGEAKNFLETVQAELDRARANLTLAQTMKDNAEKAAKELREEREKGLMEFEDRKKSQAGEIANLKLKYFEELKERELEEQARQRTIRGHQASEVARHIEMALVPIVQKQLGGDDATSAVAEFKTAIGSVVKRVMLEEQAATSGSEMEQVISSDPIIEKYKKQRRLRAQAMLAVPTAAFLLAVFAPSVFEFARDPMRVVFAGGKTEDQLRADRSYRELASKSTVKICDNMQDEVGATYADSVLCTKDYVIKKLDAKNQKRWAVELEAFIFNQLGLPEQIAVNYLAVETRLIKELQVQSSGINLEDTKLRDAGVQRLREVETATVPELKGKVGGDSAYEQIHEFEKKFFRSL